MFPLFEYESNGPRWVRLGGEPFGRMPSPKGAQCFGHLLEAGGLRNDSTEHERSSGPFLHSTAREI